MTTPNRWYTVVCTRGGTSETVLVQIDAPSVERACEAATNTVTRLTAIAIFHGRHCEVSPNDIPIPPAFVLVTLDGKVHHAIKKD